MAMQLFESIKHLNEFKQEYWKARELYKILEYSEYNKFIPTINKAKIACKNSGQDVNLHFADISEHQKSKNQYWDTQGQLLADMLLSRYACYLIAMEADSRKEIVSQAKTYFAIQSRKQEISEQNLEDTKRVAIREQLTEHNKDLARTAKKADVRNYGEFTDYGYMGLYGMRNNDIVKHKWLEESEKLLDNINSEELAANLFRATQAEAKIKREHIRWQDNASKAHMEIGNEVREMIKKIGGTMPEDLPKSENIKEAKKRIKQNKSLGNKK